MLDPGREGDKKRSNTEIYDTVDYYKVMDLGCGEEI